MQKKLLIIGLISLIVTTIWGGQLVAQADVDLDNALASAPQGITIQDQDNNMFTPGTAWKSFNVNQSKVVDVPDSSGAISTQAVEVTTGPNQVGAIWSTDSNPFPLNSNHVQETASMWMYFGNGGTSSAGEGMAFVLQNDPDKLAASPKFSTKTSWFGGGTTLRTVGETLGVWGPNDSSGDKASTIASKAIQNSWAMEFDTKVNKNNNAGDGFDMVAGVSGPHIAWNYPADPGTYSDGSGISTVPTMMHRQPVNNLTLADGQWHHITLTWDGYSQMKFRINDKDPKTGEALTGQGGDFKMDPAGAYGGSSDPTTITTTDTGETRWGFTGATGGTNDWSNNLVVFEQVPGLVNATATNELTDTTTDKTIGSGDKIKSGDGVKLTYNLGYLNGRQDWKDIVAKLNLPQNLSFTKATVAYGDETTATLTGDDLANQLAKYALPKNLSTTDKAASITLEGKANTVDQETTVAGVTSQFAGSNNVLSTDTTDFIVTPIRGMKILKLTKDPVSVVDNQGATVKGNVGMTNVPDDYDYNNVTVTATINGDTLTTHPDDGGEFTLDIPAADIKSGNNTLTVTASDEENNSSQPVTWTLSRGILQLTNVSDKAQFTTQLTGQMQRVAPETGWTVDVMDTRGVGKSWSLQASTTTLDTAPENELPGNLIYQKADGSTVTLGSSLQTVMTHTTVADSDAGTTNVTGTWSQNAGMLAQIDSDATVGNYSVIVNWQLVDGLQ